MKKRKTYEISVIDKTYSKIISDETKFYTSDTSLELDFELKETEYTFESAEIVLLNIDDRSLVTRPVAKILDSFTYELDDDIIAHYGEWRGQVRFEQDGEVYVSSPVKFRIENDISNDRPPQLSDVQSWVSLKRYADSLTEELKQAVLSVDGIEDTFNENETVRQSQFETNESKRDETFNTNEATRQENENARQQAETERATAESVRVANEAERISKDSERDSKIETVEGNLESKANKQQEEWIYPTLTNGSSDPSDPVAYRKDGFGVVHFKGRFNNEGVWGSSAFTLPSGYRLTQTMNFSVPAYIANGTATVQLFRGRLFMYRHPYTDNSINLRGLSYYAEE